MAVYFVQCGARGNPIKIGYTKFANEIEKRIADLQVGCPWELVLIAEIPGGDTKLESLLHRKFAISRIRGEWFGATTELIEFINTKCQVNPLCTYGSEPWWWCSGDNNIQIFVEKEEEKKDMVPSDGLFCVGQSLQR